MNFFYQFFLSSSILPHPRMLEDTSEQWWSPLKKKQLKAIGECVT